FFFFQAEDGIRDFHVTGVQTCALPIYAGTSAVPNRSPRYERQLTRKLSRDQNGLSGRVSLAGSTFRSSSAAYNSTCSFGRGSPLSRARSARPAARLPPALAPPTAILAGSMRSAPLSLTTHLNAA